MGKGSVPGVPRGPYKTRLTWQERLVQYQDRRGAGTPDAPYICWGWKGATDDHGRGRFKIRNTMYKAHRAAYAMYCGLDDPDELDERPVAQTCRTPDCTNPWHLEQITQGETISRAYRRGTRPRLAPWRRKVPWETIVEIRERHLAGARQADLCREYGLSDSYVSMIVNYKARLHG